MHIKGNSKNAYPFTKVFLTLSYYDHLVEMIFIWQLAIFRYLIIKALPILYQMHASLFSHSYHIKCRRNLIFTPRIKWFHSDAKMRSILRCIHSHKVYISSIFSLDIVLVGYIRVKILQLVQHVYFLFNFTLYYTCSIRLFM